MRPTTDPLVDELVAAIQRRLAGRTRPLLVGLDGRSGAGKSTLADAVADALQSAVVVKGDEFYSGGAQTEWDEHSAEEKASVAIDWQRQAEVLDMLRRGEDARWHCYDWDAFDGRLVDEVTVTAAANVVILEGAYSCRPELAEFLDLTVLLVIDDADRLSRLLQRDGREYRDDWLARWSEAEDHYFGSVRPPNSFDLILGRTAPSTASA